MKQFSDEEIRRLVPERFMENEGFYNEFDFHKCWQLLLETRLASEKANGTIKAYTISEGNLYKEVVELRAELERVKEENQRLREVLENTKKNVEFAIFRLKQQTKGADRCMTN